MRKVTIDGNEACSSISYMFTEVAGIYPITPSSPMAEHVDELSNNTLNIFNDHVKVVEMQSEAGAAGMVHGSLRSGCYTSTYTASQGLLLMIPNMYKIAGEMLPCVMHVAARSLATHALSIFGDHQDIYAARDTGFCMLASSSVQDCANLSAVSHLASIKSSLPFMHFFDGFRTSHEIDKIDLLEIEDLKPLVDNEAILKFKNRALNPLKPYTVGVAENDDIYFQGVESRNKYYQEIPNIVNEYMQKINEIAKTNYKPFNYYGSSNANKVIIAMGSVCETIKETIDYLNQNGYNVGLIEVHLYRPFSIEYLKKEIPSTVTKIAVLDRCKVHGAEPLYQDVVEALKDTTINIVGGRYGLASKNTNPSQIKAVYDMLDNPVNNFTIGIKDDVTHLSLTEESIKTSNSYEILIYGYGSDGMVSASKSFMKLIGNNTNKYVQGYFQYDSKKSGGVTKCHLRFNDNVIRSTYYVENPSIIVVTKDTYLNKFDCISNLSKNGIFILNTKYKKEEIINNIDGKILDYIKDNNIEFYIINAYDIASKLGIPNKISTIMESVLAKLTNLLDYEKAINIMKEYAKNRYYKKGEDVVNANYKAIEESINYLEKVELNNKEFKYSENIESNTIYDMVEKRMGDLIKVSEVNSDGIYESGTSKKEKRNISSVIPKWINNNCITCNMCSLYCPHGVIRPYLLNTDTYNKLPNNIKERCIKDRNNYFILSISALDCTGCGVCSKTCISKNKALEMIEVTNEEKIKEQEIFDYLEKNVTSENIYSDSLVKGSQFKEPKFMYSGACAGCGETAYIKLFTQLFGKSLMIANATGCSSIYGASAPITPYTIPWANSLFEDNAEFGYGILLGNNVMRNRIREYFETLDDSYAKKWLENMYDYDICKEVYDNIKLDSNLEYMKDYIIPRIILCVGGDGWAYDIGYSGIDHVLSSNDNINILVLDTQVYSNTGGQASKASPKGAVAAFAASGKKNNKKDLAKMALAYPHCYVAQISLGYNPNNVVKIIKEAVNYNGPSIIIAYAPCISHGIEGGLVNSVEMEKMAVESGYYPVFHYNPNDKFYLDSKNVNFDLYEEFLNKQNRFKILHKINKENADKLIQEQKQDAIERYNYYKNLDVSNNVKD